MTGRRPITAVVVDDEPLARDAVRTVVDSDPEIEIVGEASNGLDAVDVIRAKRPDLVLLDIQMPDLGGFGVLEQLGEDIPPVVLFVTAYEEHALRAFEVHALDYVLKPFGAERLSTALDRARSRVSEGRTIELEGTLNHLRRKHATAEPAVLEREGSSAPPTRLGVRSGSTVKLVRVEDVDWVEADGDYVRLHVGPKNHLLSARMSSLEERLSGAGFVRIHRSTIVNVERVTALERDPDGGGVAILAEGIRLRVAESRWPDVTRALGIDF